MNVDELVVTLSLDPSKFTAGQKEALESFRKTEEEFHKRLSNLEAKNKDVAYSFGDVTHAAEGLFGALAGTGMVAFIHDAVSSAAASGRMATNIGIARRELDAFGKVIERNGGSAESAAASLKSYADTVQNWKWGKGSPDFLMGLNQIGGASLNASPIEIVEKLAKFSETHTAQETNQVGARLGMSQDIINTIIRGLKNFKTEYRDAMSVVLSDDQNKKLADNQSSWTRLGQAIEFTAQSGLSNIAPLFNAAADAAANATIGNQGVAKSILAVLAAIISLGALKPAAWVLRILGLGRAAGVVSAIGGFGTAAVMAGSGVAAAAALLFAPSNTDNSAIDNHPPEDPGAHGGGGRDSAQVREKRIRSLAAMLGIDPDIAMRVSPAEGFNKFSGDNGTSFGDFQLHVTPGGRGNAVGDRFKKQTGLDPSDPRNEGAMDLFALRDIAQNGWHAYHGAARVGIGDHQGINTGPISITVNTDSKSPRDHGRLTGQAFQDTLAKKIADNANSGQTRQ